MNRRTSPGSLALVLLALVAALAPAPQAAAPDDLAALAGARAEAGARASDMAWLYYGENRVDMEKVYRWSRRRLEADRDAVPGKAGDLTACQAHWERMRKLQAKIDRIRNLGFGNSLDVVEVDYFRKESEFWLAQARAK